MALRDGYGAWTTELFRQDSISGTDHSKLGKGDMAVTADGVHILAYLGDQTWIQADPDSHKVVEVVLPTDIHWFEAPVVFVRWRWFVTPP
jgi:hypothetical protein